MDLKKHVVIWKLKNLIYDEGWTRTRSHYYYRCDKPGIEIHLWTNPEQTKITGRRVFIFKEDDSRALVQGVKSKNFDDKTIVGLLDGSINVNDIRSEYGDYT